MTPRQIAMLLVLAALWGASFLFMRVAVPAFGPVVLADARVAIAGVALLAYAAALGTRPALRQRWRDYLLLGAINAALPFSLLAAAELEIEASLAAVLNAMAPMCGAVVGAVWLRQRVTHAAMVGLVLGVVGVTLVVGLAAMATALILGTLVGAVAAFYGGAADAVLMRVTDGMMAVPAFFVILVVITVTGPSITTIVLVIGAVSWMPVARVVYGETLRWKGREFVVAAEALGVSRARILLRHVLPQAVPALTVSATLGVAYAILTESAISYLGLGVQAPTASWGNMLQKAQQYVFTSPSLAMYPGLAVTVVVLAFNFLGDGIRDALDPRMRA